MEANELRLGSSVYFNNNEVGIVTGILSSLDGNDVVLLNNRIDISYAVKDLSPIPITEEWLLRFGFKKYQWMDGYYIKMQGKHLMLQFYKESILLFFTKVKVDSVGEKMYGRNYFFGEKQNVANHVHQLQNLIFILNGKEPTLN